METRETRVVERTPTKVDTDKLDAAFGVPEIGTKITWEEIESVIGHERNTCRFKTVQAAWRKKLFEENNLYIAAVGLNGGLIVEKAKDRISSSVKIVGRGRRTIEKGLLIATTTPKDQMDDEDERTVTSMSAMSRTLLRLTVPPKELEAPDTEKAQCSSFQSPKLRAV